ncbi:MAG: hypothetical protein ABIF11_03265 [Nitrospirota bacterium]
MDISQGFFIEFGNRLVIGGTKRTTIKVVPTNSLSVGTGLVPVRDKEL